MRAPQPAWREAECGTDASKPGHDVSSTHRASSRNSLRAAGLHAHGALALVRPCEAPAQLRRIGPPLDLSFERDPFQKSLWSLQDHAPNCPLRRPHGAKRSAGRAFQISAKAVPGFRFAHPGYGSMVPTTAPALSRISRAVRAEGAWRLLVSPPDASGNNVTHHRHTRRDAGGRRHRRDDHLARERGPPPQRDREMRDGFSARAARIGRVTGVLRPGFIVRPERA